MKNIASFISIIHLFFFTGCNNNPNPAAENKPKAEQNISVQSGISSKDIKAVDIVLCDLTQSMVVRDTTTNAIIDSTTLQHIKKDAAEIFANAPTGTLLYYIAVGNNDLNSVLYQRAKIEVSAKPSQLARYKKENTLLIPKLISDTISKTFNPQKYKRTCITHALNNVCDIFNQYDKGTKFRLIILSDMIEDCDESPIGYFSLEKPANIKKTLKNIDTTKVGIIRDLKSLGVEVFMVYESESLYNNLTMDKLNEIWRKVLTHYGYTKDDEIYGHNSLPPKLLIND